MIDKIYVDAARPATPHDGAGKLTDFPTLQEAVMARHRLWPEQTKLATIKGSGGPVYTATELYVSTSTKAGVTLRRFSPPWTVEDLPMRDSS